MNFKWLTSIFCRQKGLPTTGEFIPDPQGVMCPVLDVNRIDFTKAKAGRKKELTYVRKALAGEKIEEVFEGGEETYGYKTKKGDAIFVNSPTDQYVPLGLYGERLKFEDLEENGFHIVEDNGDTAYIQSPPGLLLVGVVTERMCIRNAWGEEDALENHQFLSAGATLKLDRSGKITGMDKEGFKKWELLSDMPDVHKPTL